MAASGMDAAKALAIAVAISSRSDAWLVNGRPAAMAGVVPHHEDMSVGIVWMLASDEADAFPKNLLKGNREYVRSLLDDYHILVNFVDNRNIKAQRWLQWLGFTLDEPAPFGLAQLPFRRFWMEGAGASDAARPGMVLSSRSDRNCVEVESCVTP